jgi:hypothetical protein
MLLKGAHAVCCFKGRRDDGMMGLLVFWVPFRSFCFGFGSTLLLVIPSSLCLFSRSLSTCAYEIRNAMTESIITTFAFALRIT